MHVDNAKKICDQNTTLPTLTASFNIFLEQKTHIFRATHMALKESTVNGQLAFIFGKLNVSLLQEPKHTDLS